MNRLSVHQITCFMLSLAAVTCSSNRVVQAVDTFWNVANGDFLVPGNWTAGVPGMFDRAFINNGGTSNFTSGIHDVDTLTIASAGGTSGTFNMTGGDLFAFAVKFGDVGSATASVNHAILRAGGGSLFVGGAGDISGGTGALTIAGSSSLVTSGDDIQFGRSGSGTLNFQAGRMTGGFTVVGKFGTGLWNHSGGVFDEDFGDIEIGDGGTPGQAGIPGPRNGTINLTGGVIQGSGHFAIGNRKGSGTVNISGGVLDMTGDPGGTGTIFVGRGADWENEPDGSGGPVELRVMGDDAIIVANGGFSMNAANVASSSTLIAEITGPTHTPIKIVGDANITNGAFKVDLTGYTPVSGDTWTILQAGANITAELTAIDAIVAAGGYPALTHVAGSSVGSLIGNFASEDFSLAPLLPGLSWDVEYVSNSVLLKVIGTAAIPGDYNNDGQVNAADYVAWRKMPANFGGVGGYTTWRQNFGVGGSGAGSAQGVPEPSEIFLLVIGIVVAVSVGRIQ